MTFDWSSMSQAGFPFMSRNCPRTATRPSITEWRIFITHPQSHKLFCCTASSGFNVLSTFADAYTFASTASWSTYAKPSCVPCPVSADVRKTLRMPNASMFSFRTSAFFYSASSVIKSALLRNRVVVIFLPFSCTIGILLTASYHSLIPSAVFSSERSPTIMHPAAPL